MKLALDQALQHGVAAYKEGRLPDAEHLYCAILQAQPKHPDANPQIEQFWLSYIDVLMRLERFNGAKRVSVEGAKSGVSPEKLDALNQQLQGSASNDTNKTTKSQTLSKKDKHKIVHQARRHHRIKSITS